MIEKEVLENVLEFLENYDRTPAIETGFFDLDETLRGAKKSSLVVIGARPAMGKTAFTMNIMLNLLQRKKKCLFFSLEMSKENFVKRLIVQEGEINNLLLNCPEQLQQKHWEKITKAIDSISEYDLTLEDSCNITTQKIREKIEEEKPEYVFIDYLQLIHISNKKSRVDGITDIMTDLKQIAKDNDCMIFVNSQISRAVETRVDKRPMLSDLRECGAIEEIADVVIFLYRDSYYNACDEDCYNRKYEADIIVAKNKFGAVGTILLLFRGQILKFFNPVKADEF